MKVRATQLGYYGHKRRKAGDIFELVPMKNRDGSVTSVEQQFSDVWMESLESSGKAKKSEGKGKKPQESKEFDSEDSDVI